MAFLLGTLETVSDCDHGGCLDHQRRAEYKMCHAGREDLIVSCEAAGNCGELREGHLVEVPYTFLEAKTDATFEGLGWRKNGVFWCCPSCEPGVL